MFDHILKRQGIKDLRVLDAFRNVDRSLFLPKHLKNQSQENTPLPIGFEQTISQPFVVAYMLEALEIKPTDRVLEIGTGSGYQTALLCELAGEVYTVERIPELTAGATSVLEKLAYKNVYIRSGDGKLGWPEEAPFDKIVVSASPGHIPESLISQLTDGGILVSPEGEESQHLIKITNSGRETIRENLIPVRFVPLI